MISCSAASLLARFGAKPPSSPTVVGMPLASISFFSAWNTSAPQRSASRKLGAPTGMIMNSCRSRLLLACAPPLMTFIIGTGSCMRAGAAEVAVQRQAGLLGRRLGHRQRHGQHGIGAEPRLVLGAVQIDQGLVDERLLDRVQPDDRFADLGIDVLDRVQHALAEVALRVAVAQFDRLRAPVEAPEGTAARPITPDSSSTSASTVGLPRESRISRATTSTIELIAFALPCLVQSSCGSAARL